MTRNTLSKFEEKYKVKYIGYYDVPVPLIVEGKKHWGDDPAADRTVLAHVFYTPDPDVTKGHSNYLGVVRTDELGSVWLLFDAQGIERSVFPAINVPDRGFLVSRYRHDFQTFPGDKGKDAPFIDGGSCYSQYNMKCPVTHTMRVIGGEETFRPVEPEASKLGTPRWS